MLRRLRLFRLRQLLDLVVLTHLRAAVLIDHEVVRHAIQQRTRVRDRLPLPLQRATGVHRLPDDVGGGVAILHRSGEIAQQLVAALRRYPRTSMGS